MNTENKGFTPIAKNEWLDISDEMFREYIYPDGSKVRIEQPVKLHISPSTMGGHAHRVQTADRNAFYIRSGWNAIIWKVKEGQPLFKF